MLAADPMDEAVACDFLKRTLERSGGPALGEEVTTALVAIVRFCDGRPRALLEAARQLTVLSPSQLIAELEAEPLGDHPLGRELRAAGEESLRGLDEAERRALARLSVIGGAFDLDAACAVAGVARATVPPLLERASARSILSVKHDPEVPRYGS